ncbi:hypothetical protein ACL2XP_06980 [Sodalis sp. RH21]|uniref:hypothetical protein n=1 Tax=unclassified Sodalis (in: enterobacteria) TaxID=2636512 RepID=UPI0039B498EA
MKVDNTGSWKLMHQYRREMRRLIEKKIIPEPKLPVSNDELMLLHEQMKQERQEALLAGNTDKDYEIF